MQKWSILYVWEQFGAECDPRPIWGTGWLAVVQIHLVFQNHLKNLCRIANLLKIKKANWFKWKKGIAKSGRFCTSGSNLVPNVIQARFRALAGWLWFKYMPHIVVPQEILLPPIVVPYCSYPGCLAGYGWLWLMDEHTDDGKNSIVFM